MTRHEQIIARLSPGAKAALTGIGTIRQGATLRPCIDSATVNELGAHGLLGLGGGLTRTGTIVRQYLMDQALDF